MDENTPISILAQEFSKLPGIGNKTALRMAYFYVQNKNNITPLISSLDNIYRSVEKCKICNLITYKDSNPCKYCADGIRNKQLICIVENDTDVAQIEKSNSFKGVYHILGGLISPLSNISHNDLEIESLKNRVINNDDNFEIIIATNFTTEGEATSLFIRQYLKDIRNVKFSRLANGLPFGSNLEYVDSYTIGKAIERRIDYDN